MRHVATISIGILLACFTGGIGLLYIPKPVLQAAVRKARINMME